MSTSANVVCGDPLKGSVTLGVNNVIHEGALIISEKGPIIIGDSNIFEEQVYIINKSAEPMTIGSENYFETGSYVESSNIGNQNHIEPRARVLSGTTLKNGTAVGANCYTEPGSSLEDMEILYGESNTRRKQFKQSFLNSHQQHIQYLKKILDQKGIRRK